jgi:hypothetical protein
LNQGTHGAIIRYPHDYPETMTNFLPTIYESSQIETIVERTTTTIHQDLKEKCLNEKFNVGLDRANGNNLKKLA